MSASQSIPIHDPDDWDDDDVPSPPPEPDHRVVGLKADFQSLAGGSDQVAFTLSLALSCLNRSLPLQESLTSREFERLFAFADRAHTTLRRAPPAGISLGELDRGMEAAKQLLLHEWLYDDGRHVRDPIRFLDLRAHARILQNLAHNASLREEIAGRALTAWKRS